MSTSTILTFQKTDVGTVPVDWDVRTLGEALQFISGKAHEPYVSRFGDFIVVNSKFISTDGAVRKYCTANLTPARKGDVLMVMSDLPNGRALAKCFLVDEDNRYAVNQRVCIFRSKVHDARYLRYILNRNPYFMAFDDGVQQTHLLNDPIKRCPLTLPPRAEQKAIADALSDTADLISALELLIAKKQAIKQGMMQQLLTGKTRLPGFTEPWANSSLGGLAKFSKGMGLPKSSLVDGGRLPCIHYGELFTKYGAEIDVIQSRTDNRLSGVSSLKGDVLMPTSDVTPHGLAKASSVLADGVILGGDILVIRPDESQLLGCFLARLIRHDADQVLRLVRGSTVFHIYATDMKGFGVRVPPVAEQHAICDVLRSIESELDLLKARSVKAQAIKQGMMQELLTGRTRLPVSEDAS